VRPPLSTSQIERLGVRLVQDATPDEADLALLHDVLGGYSDVLAVAVERVREGLGVSPSSRVKNTGTILEKLHRYGGHWLKSIQDLAGMRIVARVDRPGQDAIVQQLVELFAADPRAPKVIDRRRRPVYGYRAVHVVVFPDGVPVEIQVRTRWQHEWAELFEKLADRVGRGIRYGEPPSRWWTPAEFDGMQAPLQAVVTSSYELRKITVDLALAVAEMIDAVETGEATTPEDPELDEYRGRVDAALVELRQYLEDL
jgi:ppGpp synthetase/RelA/SpoT-type nucleotidyltranferase